MVGLSSNQYRPSHYAALYLIAEGYDVVPVNPREPEILGRKSYPSVSAIPGQVEIVDIFLNRCRSELQLADNQRGVQVFAER